MLAKSRAQAAPASAIGESESTEKDGVQPPKYLEKANEDSAPARRKVKEQLYKVAGLLNAQRAVFLSLQKIYRTEGLSGMYSGLEGEVLKGFLSHGLTMMTKERVHVGVIELYYVLLRLTRQWPTEMQKVQQGAQAVATDARERVENVSETVGEGAKKLLDEGRKAVGGDK